MNSCERIKLALQHKEPDRVPIHDSPWQATITRWRKEGLPEGVSPDKYFGYEIVMISCDCTPRFPVKTIEQTDTFIIQTTPTGGINKQFLDFSTTPEIIERPIKEKKDWYPIKDRLYPDATRVDWTSVLNTYNAARSKGKFIAYSGGYGYDVLQSYIRTENLLMAMVEDPEWIKDMIMTLAKLTIDMVKIMMDKGIKFDGFFDYNDMGYRNGLLFSPDTYRRTHKEADEIVWSFFHQHNMPVILHSCGNVKELIPDLIEIGLDCLQPLEVKAGMDLIELKLKYGDKLAFMGGIDVRLMAAEDPTLIEHEIKTKFEVAKKGGGYIYHSDHSVPKDVSFQQYQRVIELVKKYGQY